MREYEFKIDRKAGFMTRRNALILVSSSLALAGFKSCGTPEEREQLARMVETGGMAMVTLMHALGLDELAQRYQSNVAFTAQAIRTWHPGGSTVEVIRHLNDLIDSISHVPQLDRFRPLLNYWLGTLANIIEKLQSLGAGGEKPHTEVRLSKPPGDDANLRVGWDAVRDASHLESAPVI